MLLVTFSGIDGAGKSTQLTRAAAFLRSRGLKVKTLVTLYCSVTGVHTLLRERRTARAKRTVQPRQEPQSKIRTYRGGRSFDEDRSSRGVRLRRLFVYPFDCFVCSCVIVWFRIRGNDVLLCDRYIFDKMVCLANPTGWFGRLIVRLVPKPDVAILLAADPVEAEQRKPEHTMDYFETKSQAYYEVQQAGVGLTTVGGLDIDETQQHIRSLILEKLDAPTLNPTQTESIQTASS